MVCDFVQYYRAVFVRFCLLVANSNKLLSACQIFVRDDLFILLIREKEIG
jgi:hypothetical protein